MEMELSIDSPITPVDDHSEGTESLLRRRKVRSVVLLRTQHLMAVLMKLKKNNLHMYSTYVHTYVGNTHACIRTYVDTYVVSYVHTCIHTNIPVYIRTYVCL